jgi:hypothetical protein
MNDCIEWRNAYRNSKGYGFHDGEGAHRWTWRQANGPIPPGMMVCHHCDNPGCVNLAHLYLGTAADNAADMVARGRVFTGGGADRLQRTHCRHGHEYTPENTSRDRHGRRHCRTCWREQHRARRTAARTTPNPLHEGPRP